ncbi:MAG: hypothetical protein JJU27_12010 [Gammaproteobacteria bacterium]|nr:hypothetical protein [Gammaproteobacteria bacterium]
MADQSSIKPTILTLYAEDISARRILDRRTFLLGAALGAAALPGALSAQARTEAVGQDPPRPAERDAAWFDDYARTPGRVEAARPESGARPDAQAQPDAVRERKLDQALNQEASVKPGADPEQTLEHEPSQESEQTLEEKPEADNFDDYARPRFREAPRSRD